MSETVPPTASQNRQVPIEEGAVKIRAVIHNLTQVLSTQVSKDSRVQVNPNSSTTTSRIRNFTRMNPLTFFGSKVEGNPKVFVDEVFKVLDAMRVNSHKKVEIAAYQLKNLSQVLYEQ